MLSDGTRTYTWEHGRQLKTLTQNGTTWTYTYDTNGLRTSRSNGVVTYEYYYTGTQLSWMRYLHNENSIETDLWLQFSYNAAGVPLGVTVHNGNLVAYYYYITNIQGDVVGIVSNSGVKSVTYVYDAWGNLIEPDDPGEDTIAAVNPLRYRGYVYDQETGLYYLQSRYYNPEIGRFISADDVSYLGADGSVLSYNLFAYCGNNPVMGYDPTGHWDWSLFGKIVIGTIATVAAVAVTVATGGAAAPVLLGVLANTVTSGVIGYITGGVEGLKNGLADGFMWGGISALGGSLVSAGIKAVKTARQGITIGRGMEKVNRAAGLTDTLTYCKDALWKPLKESYYNGIKRFLGEKAANSVSYACNKLYIKTMRALGAVIYDSGLNGYAFAGQFYGMELEVLKGYANLVQMF